MTGTLVNFDSLQIGVVQNSVDAAEDLVSDYYKLSDNQWLGFRYDIKTLKDLSKNEIVHGPYAQVIKYYGHPLEKMFISDCFDYYKICIQDHTIISLLDKNHDMDLYPFILYITVHELVHIVRFGKFKQFYNMDIEKRESEEFRVHELTSKIVSKTDVSGIEKIVGFHSSWII